MNKISSQTAKVIVFGLGRIGLPKAALIAKAGFQVIGVDCNPRVSKAVSHGMTNLKEPGLSSLIKEITEKELLKVTSDGSIVMREGDIIIICVPTPIKKDKTPDLSYIEDVCKNVSQGLSVRKLVIVESTLPPKATKTFIAPLLEGSSGLRCGLDFWLSYCPERISPGKALEEIIKSNKIVGGYNAESAEITAEFLKNVVEGQIFITDSTTAEVAKVAENTFRDVNIAFANEVALICEQIGVDASEVIQLANTHPRVNIHTPGPGVGGSCLPKDPYLMLSPVESEGFNSKIVKASRLVNDLMPKHIVNLVIRGLHQARKDIETVRIAVLGTAYKANVDDARLSPSEAIIHELASLGAVVTVYDPHCKENFGARRMDSVRSAVKNADCMIIATDHAEFKNINLSKLRNLMNSSPIIVDGRRVVDPELAEKLGFKYYGIGFGKGA